jgi:hypothetical protein
VAGHGEAHSGAYSKWPARDYSHGDPRRDGPAAGAAPGVTSPLAEPVPAAMFDTAFVLPYLQAFGQYHLAMGHRQSALANFESCTDLMAKWSADTPAAAPEDQAEPPGPADFGC